MKIKYSFLALSLAAAFFAVSCSQNVGAPSEPPSGSYIDSPAAEDMVGWDGVPESFTWKMAVLEQNSRNTIVTLQLPYMTDLAQPGCDVLVKGKPVDAAVYDGGVCITDERSEFDARSRAVSHDIQTYTAVVPSASPDDISFIGDIHFWQMPAGSTGHPSLTGTLEKQEMKVNASASDLYLNHYALQLSTPVLLSGHWYVRTFGDVQTDADSIDKIFRFKPIIGEPDPSVFDQEFTAFDEYTEAPAELPEGCTFTTAAAVDGSEIVLTASITLPEDEDIRLEASNLADHVSILYGSEVRFCV